MISTDAVLTWFAFLAPVLWLYFLYYAYKNDREHVNLLYAAAIFGYFLEFSTVVMFRVFSYNSEWPFNMFGTPFTVSFSWANFLYGAKLFFDATNLKENLRPIAYAVFVITIDWVMDPVAVRVDMWTWVIDTDGTFDHQYFGISWANFYGWLAAVSMFTYGYYYISNLPKESIFKKYSVISTFLFGVVSAGIVNGLFVLTFIQGLPKESGGRLVWLQIIVVFALYIAGIIILIRSGLRITSKMSWIPAISFLGNLYSYIVIGFANGYFEDILLLIISIVVTIVLTVLTLPPINRLFIRSAD